jgi:hypothetical protein
MVSESRSDDPDQDAIARRAYELFCERGCEHGHDLEDWLAAENQLRAAIAAPETKPEEAVGAGS